MILACPWISPVFLSDTLTRTIKYGVEISLKSSWKFNHKLEPTISHPLLGGWFVVCFAHMFLKERN